MCFYFKQWKLTKQQEEEIENKKILLQYLIQTTGPNSKKTALFVEKYADSTEGCAFIKWEIIWTDEHSTIIENDLFVFVYLVVVQFYFLQPRNLIKILQ